MAELLDFACSPACLTQGIAEHVALVDVGRLQEDMVHRTMNITIRNKLIPILIV